MNRPEPANIGIITLTPDALRFTLSALEEYGTSTRHRSADGTVYHRGSIHSSLTNRDYSYVLTCVGSTDERDVARSTQHMIGGYEPQLMVLVCCFDAQKEDSTDVIIAERLLHTRYDHYLPEDDAIIVNEWLISNHLRQDIIHYLGLIHSRVSTSKDSTTRRRRDAVANLRAKLGTMTAKHQWEDADGTLSRGDAPGLHGFHEACQQHALEWVIMCGNVSELHAADLAVEFLVNGLDLGSVPAHGITPTALDSAPAILSSLRLSHFKSFDDQMVTLGPVVLLVGANAAGKSNLLDALRFIQGIGLDISVLDILRGHRVGGRALWPGIRGGVADAATKEHDVFTIACTWQVAGNDVTHELACRVAPDVHVEHEMLRVGATAVEVRAAEHDGIPALVHASPSSRKALNAERLPATHSLLSQLHQNPRLLADQMLASAIESIRTAMRSALFLHIAPARMRQYVPRDADDLGAEGENVSAMVWKLCQNADAKQDLVDWLSELCAPELDTIEFVETELGDVMLVFVEKDGRRIAARSLSDGTLRFLGELMALRTAPRGSLLLLEEIENGLHPMRVHLLVEAMEAMAEERDLRILATTHSASVLHALSKKALHDAIVVARASDQPGTVMRRLGDLPDFDEVAERRGVDYLFTTGWLERAL